MTTYAIVGAGWRAELFLHITEGLPSLECVGAVVRTPRPLSVPTFASLSDCAKAARPDFVVTAVP